MQVYGFCIRTLRLPVISVMIIFFIFFFKNDDNTYIEQTTKEK